MSLSVIKPKNVFVKGLHKIRAYLFMKRHL